VWWDGFYGADGHRRPRYKCVRPGRIVHVFTEPLPRQLPPSGECYECDRDYQRIDGPQSPRDYAFVAREIAVALVRVGQGAFYARAGADVRRRAQRRTVRSRRRWVSTYGNVVEDWVEVWAELIHQQIAGGWATTVPEVIVLDDLPFHVGKVNVDTGLPVQSGRMLFHIYGAVAYHRQPDGDLINRVLRFEAYPKNDAASWRDFLGRLPGPPARVITDEASGIMKAIPIVWPSAEVFICNYHLFGQGHRRLAKRRLHGRHSPLLQALRSALRYGRGDLDAWAGFTELVRTDYSHVRPLMEWLDVKDALITRQLSSDYYPVGNGAVETALRSVKNSIYDRRFAFGNQARTNRLLLLMELHINAEDDEALYSHIIRTYLEEHAGKSPPRRRILDPFGTRSIRPA